MGQLAADISKEFELDEDDLDEEAKKQVEEAKTKVVRQMQENAKQFQGRTDAMLLQRVRTLQRWRSQAAWFDSQTVGFAHTTFYPGCKSSCLYLDSLFFKKILYNHL